MLQKVGPSECAELFLNFIYLKGPNVLVFCSLQLKLMSNWIQIGSLISKTSRMLARFSQMAVDSWPSILLCKSAKLNGLSSETNVILQVYFRFGASSRSCDQRRS